LAEPPNAYARSLAKNVFFDAAREDYLVARSSWFLGFHHQFAWSAQQTIEKLLKYTLVLHGHSVKNSRHNIEKLWEVFSKKFQAISSALYCPPRGFPLSKSGIFGSFETWESIISRFEDNGDPNNRYRYYGLRIDSLDLHKFDELVFQISRVCINTNDTILATNETYYDYLGRDRVYNASNMAFAPKPPTYSAHQRKLAVYELFYRSNFSFRPIEDSNFPDSIAYGSMVSNPPFLNISNFKEGRLAIEWITEHAYFSKSDRGHLEQLLKEKQEN
jgi:hypothetical protein